MLVFTTGAILITSVDRAILFRVLPTLQEEFGLSNTAAGFLGSLNSLGVVIGAIIVGVFGDALGKGINRAWTWAVAATVTIVSSVATAFVHTLGGLQFSSTAAGFVIDTYGHSANFVFLAIPCPSHPHPDIFHARDGSYRWRDDPGVA